jgi:hypothetical protein
MVWLLVRMRDGKLLRRGRTVRMFIRMLASRVHSSMLKVKAIRPATLLVRHPLSMDRDFETPQA